MNVEVVSATTNPMDVISIAAGCSYGKSDISHKRVERCFADGHMSVFEHAVVTLKISGISRACCDQLTRHRMASFVVQSQRYVKQDEYDWYVTPPRLERTPGYTKYMNHCMDQYKEAIDCDVRPEDARFILPMAAKTNVVMTVNVRELFHMFDMRIDKAAQWEIHALFEHIRSVVASIDEQWRQLILLYNESK